MKLMTSREANGSVNAQLSRTAETGTAPQACFKKPETEREPGAWKGHEGEPPILESQGHVSLRVILGPGSWKTSELTCERRPAEDTCSVNDLVFNRLYVYMYKYFLSFIFQIFFYFLAAPQHMEVLGQGSDPSRSCDLCWRYGNAGPVTHCVMPGIKPAPWRCTDVANPIAPQQELILFFLSSHF